jgi:hypothetical protein
MPQEVAGIIEDAALSGISSDIPRRAPSGKAAHGEAILSGWPTLPLLIPVTSRTSVGAHWALFADPAAPAGRPGAPLADEPHGAQWPLRAIRRELLGDAPPRLLRHPLTRFMRWLLGASPRIDIERIPPAAIDCQTIQADFDKPLDPLTGLVGVGPTVFSGSLANQLNFIRP